MPGQQAVVPFEGAAHQPKREPSPTLAFVYQEELPAMVGGYLETAVPSNSTVMSPATFTVFVVSASGDWAGGA